MKLIQLISLPLFSSLLIASGFNNEALATSAETEKAEESAAHHSGVFNGELIETFNSGGYTYAHLKTDTGSVWAAGPNTSINKSDTVSFIGKVAMIDFYSKSLDRKFKNIYFVDAFIINGIKTNATAIDPHKKINKQQAAAIKSFAKAEGGQNIAEILNNKDKFAGKTIKVRGQVSKYTASVMGKNWLHIRDNSSDMDITLTTDADAQLNDIVVAEGTLILNKDYGYGYIYEVLIENATLTAE